METLVYLAVLFGFLFIGAFVGKFFIPKNWITAVDKALTICLYVLLFSMGVRTGLIDNIEQQLAMIGIASLSFAVTASFGSVFVVVAVRKILVNREIRRKNTITQPDVSRGEKSANRNESFSNYSELESKKSNKSVKSVLKHMKDPLKLLFLVLLGSFLSFFTPLFNWFTDSITEQLLYMLLFLVGMQMVLSNTNMIEVLKNPISIILPLLTIIGSLSGSLIMPLCTKWTIPESLAVASGFGWYSLSGVLLSDLGDPVLGSIAFLSNLFRESIAFIMIPLLAGFGQKRAAISIAGATSMDVTLPSIEKSCGVEFVPLSLAHGVLLTLVVPFLVPLVYSIV